VEWGGDVGWSDDVDGVESGDPGAEFGDVEWGVGGYRFADEEWDGGAGVEWG
jgi:hypothetical protein